MYSNGFSHQMLSTYLQVNCKRHVNLIFTSQSIHCVWVSQFSHWKCFDSGTTWSDVLSIFEHYLGDIIFIVFVIVFRCFIKRLVVYNEPFSSSFASCCAWRWSRPIVSQTWVACQNRCNGGCDRCCRCRLFCLKQKMLDKILCNYIVPSPAVLEFD